MLVDCSFLCFDIISEGHQEGFALGLAHVEVAGDGSCLSLLDGAVDGSVGQGEGILIGSAFLGVLVELLIDVVLVAVFGG